VRVFLEKVMLDRPDMVEAKLVSQATLFESVVINQALGFPGKRARGRQLEKDSKFDVPSSYQEWPSDSRFATG
jgi:hypothetical protein